MTNTYSGTCMLTSDVSDKNSCWWNKLIYPLGSIGIAESFTFHRISTQTVGYELTCSTSPHLQAGTDRLACCCTKCSSPQLTVASLRERTLLWASRPYAVSLDLPGVASQVELCIRRTLYYWNVQKDSYLVCVLLISHDDAFACALTTRRLPIGDERAAP